MRTIVMSACLAVCACTPIHYTRPGGTQADLDADFAKCKARTSAIESPYSGQLATIIESCMQEKGWMRN